MGLEKSITKNLRLREFTTGYARLVKLRYLRVQTIREVGGILKKGRKVWWVERQNLQGACKHVMPTLPSILGTAFWKSIAHQLKIDEHFSPGLQWADITTHLATMTENKPHPLCGETRITLAEAAANFGGKPPSRKSRTKTPRW